MTSIAIGSDHAGFEYKEAVKAYLQSKGIEVKDFGTHSGDAVDYPDYIRPAALAVARGECDAGIVFGGSGNGEAIVANKVKGIRCAVCWDVYTARMSKAHNNANVISIGQRTVPRETAIEIVAAWLNAAFEGDRHQRRVDKIAEYDQGYV